MMPYATDRLSLFAHVIAQVNDVFNSWDLTNVLGDVPSPYPSNIFVLASGDTYDIKVQVRPRPTPMAMEAGSV